MSCVDCMAWYLYVCCLIVFCVKIGVGNDFFACKTQDGKQEPSLATYHIFAVAGLQFSWTCHTLSYRASLWQLWYWRFCYCCLHTSVIYSCCELLININPNGVIATMKGSESSQVLFMWFVSTPLSLILGLVSVKGHHSVSEWKWK
jgi:hypothetical protein